ncbi:dolichol kinase [Pycnococcus provasolii]
MPAPITHASSHLLLGVCAFTSLLVVPHSSRLAYATTAALAALAAAQGAHARARCLAWRSGDPSGAVLGALAIPWLYASESDSLPFEIAVAMGIAQAIAIFKAPDASTTHVLAAGAAVVGVATCWSQRAAAAITVAVYVVWWAGGHAKGSFTMGEAMAVGQVAGMLVLKAADAATVPFPPPAAAVAVAAFLTLSHAALPLAHLVLSHAALTALWLAAIAAVAPLAFLLRSRKLFHVLAAGLFAPPLSLSARNDSTTIAYVAAASASMLSAFAAADVASRSFQHAIPSSLVSLFSRVTDDRDAGAVVWSHAALLAGICAPTWLTTSSSIPLSPASTWLLVSGAASLGVGDTLASAIGRRFGTIKIAANHPKTVEGTFAFLVGTSCMLFVCAPPPDFVMACKVVLCVMVSALLEASTDQLDNLFVPLHMYAILSILQ